MIPAVHGQRSVRALTAAAFLLGVTVLLTGEFTPGYDHRYDTVSRLASPGQPFAMVVRLAIVAVGVLVTLTARALWKSAVTYRRVVSLFVGVAGTAAVVVGVAPKDRPDVDPTTVSQLHVAASLIGVGALIAAMIYVTWSNPHRVERRRSAASLTLIVIAGTAFPFTWGSVVYGLLQRIILLTALAWLVATARRSSAGGGGPEGRVPTAGPCTRRSRRRRPVTSDRGADRAAVSPAATVENGAARQPSASRSATVSCSSPAARRS